MRTIARMESFVWYIVAGGIALVAGLWVLEFGAAWTLLWGAGIALATLGIAGLSVGIESEIEW